MTPGALTLRSSRPEVRNPVLALPAAKAIQERLDGPARAVLADLLADLAKDASARAKHAWKTHKAPMALYWKVVAVYARHLSRAIRGA